ncbi:MAG TPA: TadE family type IV pilus minor pilin [Actinomycetota bacterium]|nr:TadE family type IV pilus minor pilin [Actinomycetota bacterium]
MTPRNDDGQATIELALSLPVLVVLMMVMVWVAGLATDHVRVWHAAREAARVAAVDHDPEQIEAAAAAGGLDRLDVTVDPSPDARIRGEPVTVTVSYRPGAGVPLLGSLGGGFVMSARSTMRIERP